MLFLNSLSDWFRKRNSAEKTPDRPNGELRLEQLEDRLVPATPFQTETLIVPTINITPGFTVTEQISLQVIPFGTYNPSTGVTTPPPTTTPQPGGAITVILNNLQQTATLNSSGQATFTFQVPLLAFLTSQTLEAENAFFTDSSGDQYFSSTFLAPIYKNWDNVLVPSSISFVQPTPQQLTNPVLSSLSLTPFNSVAGETNSILGGLVKFNYVDPGNIQNISALGLQLPALPLALQLGAFNGIAPPSSSSGH
jgi:hypothetical protein